MAGGSGLYIDAVLYGIDDLPSVNPEIRAEIQKKLENEGIESLRNDLRMLDPETYHRVDLRNPKRIQKALEISIQTGKPYSSFLTSEKKTRDFTSTIICLNTERESLYKRINRRVQEMIEGGLVEEVKSLQSYHRANALKTVGYKEIFDYLDGNLSLNEAIEKIQANTRKYARKQITWFRKYSDAKWFEPTQIKEILQAIGK